MEILDELKGLKDELTAKRVEYSEVNSQETQKEAEEMIRDLIIPEFKRRAARNPEATDLILEISCQVEPNGDEYLCLQSDGEVRRLNYSSIVFKAAKEILSESGQVEISALDLEKSKYELKMSLV